MLRWKRFLQMHPDQFHIVLIISPLRSLMLDQVQRWREKKFSAACILQKKEMAQDDIAGKSSFMAKKLSDNMCFKTKLLFRRGILLVMVRAFLLLPKYCNYRK